MRDTRRPLGCVYVGRGPGGRLGQWGNPFRIGIHGDRWEVLAAYEHWAMDEGIPARARRELHGRDLVCWCKPAPCHGDLLLVWANEDYPIGEP